MTRKTLYFGEPNLGKDEEAALQRVLRSKWIGFGKESALLEGELTEYVGAKHGVIVSSCTAALHLALILEGVGKGDEVITTALTFAATANAILYTGATPVFADIDPKTLNIDPVSIERVITKKTKGIMLVHFGGLPCDMKKINALAKRRGLFVIEDAAHAIGARSLGAQVGSGKNIACFSFYPNKNLTTVEGGFMTVPDRKKAERAKHLRLHGLESDAWKRWHDRKILTSVVTELGYKYNTTDVNSAIGRVQLKKLDRGQRKRESYAALYDRVLAGIEGVTLQPKPVGKETRHALHLYTIVIDPKRFRLSRDEIVLALRGKGIFAVVHYEPLHLHPFYRKVTGVRAADVPYADRAGKNILTLPLLPQFSKKDAMRVAVAARDVLMTAQK
ncbi:DegT/DnrJ/EryC1/StrS family aminotransferase [Candidatus Kaiserbacteria bacterium]|nr:DegT/DnrJ/EryC1/StrS family aminotransferase [Candidatus Kaiserbacteria bacterium]